MTYRPNARITADDDARRADEMAARVDSYLMHQAHIHVPNAHRDAGMFANLDLIGHGQDLARGRGESPPGSPVSLWDHEIQASRSNGTDNLPSLTSSALSKATMLGWEAASTTYQHWCVKGSTPNFMQAQRVGLDQVPTLEKVSGMREIPLAPRSDRREYLQVSTYAKRFSFSREAALGDDAGAIAREALEYGRTARRTVQKVVTELLTSASGVGPTLNQDSLALFHATHGNYVASSGGPPSVTTLDAARKAMRTRTDPTTGVVLNVAPKFLLVPAALETVARILVSSQNTTMGDDENDLRVLVDPALDAVSATAWYLTADPLRFDTVETAFLGGRDAPTVEQTSPWERDGVESRVRIDFGVTVRDFRTLYRNIGA